MAMCRLPCLFPWRWMPFVQGNGSYENPRESMCGDGYCEDGFESQIRSRQAACLDLCIFLIMPRSMYIR